MSERKPLLTFGQWTLVLGVALGIVGTLFVQHLLPSNGPTHHYPIYVAKDARSLISASDCATDGDGNYWISGTVNAPPGSGILKISGFVNFGNQGQSKYPNNVPSVYAYFDTNDPTYQPDSGGAFAVEVSLTFAGIANQTGAKYCWVTAHYM